MLLNVSGHSSTGPRVGACPVRLEVGRHFHMLTKLCFANVGIARSGVMPPTFFSRGARGLWVRALTMPGARLAPCDSRGSQPIE